MRPAIAFTAAALAAAVVVPRALPAAAGYEAGAARIDITPETPIRLSGYGGRVLPSEGVEDRLQARVLAMKDPAGVLTVIISVDSIGVPHWVRESLIGRIRGRLGIYHVRLALSSTHSHAAPCLAQSIDNLLAMSPDETEVVRRHTEELMGKLVKAVEAALKALKPARMVHGKGTAAFARNRRTAGGPVDHDLPVLAALDAEGKPIAIAFNYACHATTLGGEFNRLSGDWPGSAARAVEEDHPGAVALPLIGCGGDANPHPRGQLEHARSHGREIAAAVKQVLAGRPTPLTSRLDAQLEYVTLRFAEPPSKEELEKRAASGPAHVKRLARRHLDLLASGGSIPRTLSYPVQVFSFGTDLTLVFLAGEVVVDYALRLKRELPGRNLWITAYANDVPCYIASRRLLGEGGYEVDDSMVWYGQPGRWDPSVEDIIVHKARELVETTAGVEALRARVKPPGPLSPRQALASFRLPEGFGIELAAGEPEVTDPVAIAFDECGRLFAAEMRDYPLGPGEGKPFDGRVRLLEDLDLDGYHERSTVFAENVPYANGIACARGGVYVTCAPELIHLMDTDGDGRADVRRVVYTGFNLGNSQHLLNTIEPSIDNWLYFNGGDSADLRSPADPKLPPLKISAVNFRFDPRTLQVEPTTGYQGGYGIAFDPHGNRFVCDNQTHAMHVVLERGYLGRNPNLRVEETVKDLTDHGARVHPASKPLERFNDPWDAGRFSSACGVHVYLGDALPDPYRGSHFVCEPVSNLVHRDVLAAAGASFTARRGEAEGEFLTSTDHWFRPVSCDTGPDGALYIVDMYREVIEHPEWIPEHIQKLFDLRSGMDRGRIWRVFHGKPPERRKPDLASAKNAELVGLLSHPNGWRRLTAQRLLVDRADPDSRPLLEREVREGKQPLGRLHALWALEGLGGLTEPVLQPAFDDPSPAVRGAAAQIAGGLGNLSLSAAAPTPRAARVLAARIARLARDPDARVRFQAALSLGALPPEERLEPLAEIALQDAADPWTRTAVLTSLDADPLPVLRALIERGGSRPDAAEMVRGLARLAGDRGRPAEALGAIDLLTRGAPDAPDPSRVPALSALLSALGPEGLERALAAGGAAGEAARKALEARFDLAERRARDESLALDDRRAAAELLGHAGPTAALPRLKELLDPRHPRELQRQAVEGLLRLPGSETRREVTRLLLDSFAAQTPQFRAEVLDGFLKDPERREALVEAIEKGAIRPEELDPARRKALADGSSGSLGLRAAKALAELRADPDRARLVEDYRRALAAAGGAAVDPERGEELFLKHCSTCHRAGDRGSAVGADLSGMRSREPDALLADILDPSRAVAPEYLNYAAMTRDRRLFTGILAAESPASITLKRAEGKTDSILRRDLAELRSTGQSLMPEGLEKELTPRDVGDLIAFVRGGLAGFGAGADGGAGAEVRARLREALAFHAPFDGGPHAAFARGDPKLYTASALYKTADAREGLASGNVTVLPGKGRHGDCLKFARKETPAVYFRAGENFPYKKGGFGGTVSFWMSLDPDQDLEPGFADPVQITEREWNDAAFFVDFSKDDRPRHFRLGVFADRAVWDPGRRNWDDVPPAERPMVDVARKVFARGRWTHVAFTFSSFNTGREDGAARLYLDGEPAGSIEKRNQTFTWDPAKAAIWLGLSYVGLLDDLAVFDRELSAEEVRALGRLEGGVKSLRG